MTYCDEALFGHPLAMTSAQVAALTRSQREARVSSLIADSFRILDDAIVKHVTADGRAVAGIVTLFSGGNDSTVLAHLFRPVATHAAHANTGIGIEQTREFVRTTCEEWGLPLLERHGDSYVDLVLDQGFPGPGHHFKMYQRLKERALRQVRRELVRNPRRERVVFLAGRRRDESQRRTHVPAAERVDATVWVSPLIHWTKLDLNTYRLIRGDVPINEVSDLIHMSGECLCGAFASPGERAELDHWFPRDMSVIDALEVDVANDDRIPEYRKTWGWGANPATLALSRERPGRVGALCSSCDDRFQGTLFDGVSA